MEATITKIDLNNLDKSTWETFTFEEIASKVSETVDPNKTELEIYIGLEHIDAEDIHIRRKGTPDDVNGQKLKCYPGDVIFGKRRAYQRKAAIVDFEGICSAHAFVLRANTEVIDPKLFPFFLHSDQFMHRMVDISVGGLSPTINWGDLKHQEFLLPPKDQQIQLAELLWAMDEVIEKEKQVLNSLDTNYECLVNKIYRDNPKIIKLKNIQLDYFKGISLDDKIDGDYLLAPSGAVFPGYLKIDSLKKVKVENDKLFDKIIIKNDILFNTGGVGTLGRSHFFNKENQKYFCDSFVLVIRIKDANFLSKFIYYLFQSNLIKNQIIQNTKGTTGITSISVDGIFNFKIPNKKIEYQEKFVKELDAIENMKFKIEVKLQSSQSLQKSLINQVF